MASPAAFLHAFRRPEDAAGAEPPAPLACRNCGTTFSGNYCPECGQESDTRMPGVWAFLYELFTHHVGSGGKLPVTLWRLFTRPGALSADYYDGVRARYIRPVRLYLVASIAFFVVGGVLIQHMVKPLHIADAIRIDLDKETAGEKSGINARIAQRARQWTSLPDETRSELLVKGVFEYAPKVMFMLLPLFALITRALYWRRALPYAAHLVFALHYHAVIFFAALLMLAAPWKPLVVGLTAYVLLYLPVAMRRAFGGRIWVTVLRLLTLLLLQGFIQSLAVAGLLFAVLLL